MSLFQRGPSTGPLLIADMEAPFVRLLLFAATVGGLVAGCIWLIGRDPAMLAGTLGSLALALASLWQVVSARERAVVALLPAYPCLVVVGELTDLEPVRLFSLLGLVFAGIVTVAFIRERTRIFVVAYSAMLVVATLIETGRGVAASLDAAVVVSAFLTGAIGTHWIRNRFLDSAGRFLNLFERAPVSLWEEDFSKVGEWLARLRTRGVVDLRGYLAANPSALRDGMGLIEVIRVNREAARFLEVDDPGDLVGRLRPETFPEDSLPSMVAQFEAIWTGQDQVTVEVHQGYTVKGNTIEGLLHWVVQQRLGEPDLSRVIVSVIDVSEMHNTRRRIEQSLRSKDELIATVSHELRTPLTTVVGLSSELNDHFEDFGEHEIRELLQMIADQSMEAATIVDDLLVAARAESGTLQVAMAPVDLHLEVRATLRGLDVEQEVDCHTIGVVPIVHADSGRVRQILRNLLVNAKRYGTEPIRVVVFGTDDGVWVEVRDGGERIADEEAGRVFERYYRARQTPGMTTSAGLGLTVSRELARAMGGELTYRHDGESVFTLELPRPVAAEQARSA
ncbi:MAG: HAMP domain-containing sensor histidine kinase [Acidimicrobiia bacterium]